MLVVSSKRPGLVGIARRRQVRTLRQQPVLKVHLLISTEILMRWEVEGERLGRNWRYVGPRCTCRETNSESAIDPYGMPSGPQ